MSDWAALQAFIEVCLGSILHALHVPMAGHFLSLNQGLLLSLATRKATSRKAAIADASGMGLVVALLKTLSPAGKKLLPMLAISIQSFLYALGILFLGNNLAGALLGVSFLSMWGFAQPVLIAILLFGTEPLKGLIKAWEEIAKVLSIDESWGWKVLLACVVLKILFGQALVVWSRKEQSQLIPKYTSWLEKKSVALQKKASSKRESAAQIRTISLWDDLLNPFFIISFMVSAALFYFSQNKNMNDLLFYILRVFCIALAFFWILRKLPSSWGARAFKKFPQLKLAYERLSELRSRT